MKTFPETLGLAANLAEEILGQIRRELANPSENSEQSIRHLQDQAEELTGRLAEACVAFRENR